MSDQLTLPAEARDRAGKGASRALRRDGRVPAVVYGEKKEPLAIHVEEKLLYKMLLTGHFMNSVVMIDFEGKPHRTLPKAVDFHPVTSRPIYVDFLRIGEHTKVTVAVPVRFDNEEELPGLKRGGVLNVVQHELELVCDASKIPNEIHVALDGLEIGDSIHISQVSLPEGVVPANEDEDFTVATIVAPSAMKAEEEEEAAAPLLPRKASLPKARKVPRAKAAKLLPRARKKSNKPSPPVRGRGPRGRAVVGAFRRNRLTPCPSRLREGSSCNCGSVSAIRAVNMRFSGTMSASWPPTSSPRCMIFRRGRRSSEAWSRKAVSARSVSCCSSRRPS